MKYVMLLVGSEAEWESGTPEEIEAGMREVFAWFEKWGPTGKIADGGARLDRAATAKTIRPGAVVTDGPFADLKEAIGGIVMLEADSIDDAVAVARTWPRLTGSTKVEVRPIIEM
ncbi:MAG TPA: YciI family protein [Micromonosporaceae bacterium]